MSSYPRCAASTSLLLGALVPVLAWPAMVGRSTVVPDPAAPDAASQISVEPFGTWSLGASAPGHLLATHAILLRNNKILVVGGSSYNCCFKWGMEEARLYTIGTNAWSAKMASPAPYGATKDAFCGGHAHDDLGRVIFQGGLLGYGVKNGSGINNAARYDAATGAWTQLGAASAHWYPTLVAGPRHMFIFPGRATGGDDHVRKLKYGTSAWADTGKRLIAMNTYPRVALLPDGRFFVASPAADEDGQLAGRNYFYDPVINNRSLAGNDVVPDSGGGVQRRAEHDVRVSTIHDDWSGTGVLLPLTPSQQGYDDFKFALIGGNEAHVKDLSVGSPAWTTMGARSTALGSPPLRFHANATLLPTGQVLVTGGMRNPGNDDTGVREAEVYDPATNSWIVTSAATVPRNYHSVALLLPDGRVWTASASKDASGSECLTEPNENPDNGCDDVPDGLPEMTEERVEIFTPWYYGRSDRPVITTCPAKISTDGGAYRIPIGGSQGTNIGKVALIRAGSVTHAFDTDQRLIFLDITTKTAAAVGVRAPYGAAAAPPGDYLLFALRAVGSGFKTWVPSVGCWTRVEPQVVRHGISMANYQTVFDGIRNQGYRPTWVDGFEVAGVPHYNAIFTRVDVGWVARHSMDGTTYQTEFNTWRKEGYRLAQVDSYLADGQIRYAAIWEKRAGPVWTAYHGASEATHVTNFNTFKEQGYRPVNISAVNVNGRRFYTALYDKANVGTYHTLTGMTEAQYQTEFNNQVKAGRRVSYVNAFMEGGVPKISAIWDQSDAGGWSARHDLTGANFQHEWDNHIGQGFQTRRTAGYEKGGIARFAAIWTKK